MTCPSVEETAFLAAQALRVDKLRALIAEGETNPARIIARLEDEYREITTEGWARASVGRLTPPPYSREFTNRTMYPDAPRMPTGVPTFVFTTLSQTRAARPFYGDFDALPQEILLDAVRLADFDAVVEVGADLGQRLAALFLRGAPRSIPYFAAEPSATGRAGAEMLSGFLPGMDLRPVAFEIGQPDFSFLAPFRNVLLFSFSAFSTTTRLPANTFATMASAAACVQAYHFEAVGQQIRRDNPSLAWHYERADERQLNLDFVPLLLEAHRTGVIRAEFLVADAFDLSIGYPVSIAIWQSNRA